MSWGQDQHIKKLDSPLILSSSGRHGFLISFSATFRLNSCDHPLNETSTLSSSIFCTKPSAQWPFSSMACTLSPFVSSAIPVNYASSSCIETLKLTHVICFLQPDSRWHSHIPDALVSSPRLQNSSHCTGSFPLCNVIEIQ